MASPSRQRVRSIYGKLLVWVSLILLGGMILVLGSSNRDSFIQPGSLTAAHAGVQQCESCHTAAGQNPLQWLQTAVSAEKHHNSELCLDCHQVGESALLAHSLPVEALSRTETQEMSGTDANKAPTSLVGLSQSLGWAPEPGDELQCKSCHKEHSGNDKLISRDSPDHCQTCHSQSFKSFDHGHPDFSNFPFGSGSQINFDHPSHISKHFLADEHRDRAPESCQSCHSLDKAGTNMLTGDFEQNCASCHMADVTARSRAGASGYAVLNVPGIDVETLREKNIFIGGWPASADAELSPFMQLLLQSDVHYASVQAALSTLDPMDLREASEEQLQAVATLAWCVKMLLGDIVNGGTGFLQSRLEKSLGLALGDDQLAALLATLPRAVIQTASAEWFPTLDDDLAMHKSGKSMKPEVTRSETSFLASNQAAVTNRGNDLLLEEPDPADSRNDVLFAEDDDEALFAEDADEDLWSADDNEDEAADLPVTLGSEEWAKAGGWYQDGLTLYYRPSGHADRFVHHWLELSAGHPAAQAFYAVLSDDDAPGKCTQCHKQIDEDGETEIYWFARYSERKTSTSPKGLTHYRHAPHLNMLNDQGCQTCHKLQTGETTADDTNDARPLSFQFMSKSQCDTCHRQSLKNQSCLSCHNYHGQDIQPLVSGNDLSAMFD